ncbi:MAG: hypothetical protein HYX34_06990 [Actinobacteria bacterium]|nr:hypothetical protein [Actinomycetota bacterium]
MSATKLVLHHRYEQGIALDRSGFANHGQVIGAESSWAGPNAGTLRFDAGPDRVVVAPAPTLDRLGEFHAKVRFFAEPDAPGGDRRMNLIEAELCFALFIESGWRIGATTRFVDQSPGPVTATGWDGIFTGPATVTPNSWHTVDFLFDGLSHARVFLDGALVGERWDQVGPIQGLGANGVYIGHWPGDDRYSLRGNLAEVAVWREDPGRDPGRNLDDCCMDRGWVDARVAEARRAGWDAPRATASLRDLAQALRRAAGQVRGGDPARAARTGDATRRAMAAMRLGHGGAFADAVGDLRNEIDASLSPAVRQMLTDEIMSALLAGPLGLWLGPGVEPDDATAFLEGALGAACLDGMAPPLREGRRPPPEDRSPDVPPGDGDTDVGLPPWAAGQPRPAPEPATDHDERDGGNRPRRQPGEDLR